MIKTIKSLAAFGLLILPVTAKAAGTLSLQTYQSSLPADGTSRTIVLVTVTPTTAGTASVPVTFTVSGPATVTPTNITVQIGGDTSGGGQYGVGQTVLIAGTVPGTATVTATAPDYSPASTTVALTAVPSPIADKDSDGIADVSDNCPTTSNQNQLDRDGDRVGDVCDRWPNNPRKS